MAWICKEFMHCIGMLTLLTLMLAVMVLTTGCQPNMEPVERAANTLMTEVVRPAVEKAGAELSQRSAQLQGQGSAINPGYVLDGYGIVGTGFVWKATIRLDGVSANLAGATQGDQGTDLKPANKEPSDVVVPPGG